MVGIYVELFVGRGWGSSALFMLRSMVEPEIAYLSVNLFMLLTSLNATITSETVAFIVKKYDYDPI